MNCGNQKVPRKKRLKKAIGRRMGRLDSDDFQIDRQKERMRELERDERKNGKLVMFLRNSCVRQ